MLECRATLAVDVIVEVKLAVTLSLSRCFQTNGFASPRHDMTSPDSRARHASPSFGVTSSASSSLQRAPKARQHLSPAPNFAQQSPSAKTASNASNLLPLHTTVTSAPRNGSASFAKNTESRAKQRHGGQRSRTSTGEYMPYDLVDSDV